MEQVLFGGYYNLLHATSTEYNSLVGGSSWTYAEVLARAVVSVDGVIKQLRVKLSGAPGVGTHYTFTLLVNSNPTALTFDIADDATSGSNMVIEIDITGDDTVSIQCDPDGTPIAVYATWSCVFEGDTANESLILLDAGGGSGYVSPDVINYSQVMGSFSVPTPIADFHNQVIPTAGTIKNFYVQLSTDPGTPPEGYRFTLRKGPPEGPKVNTALTVTITANDRTGSDLINTVDVVAGEISDVMIEPLNNPTGSAAFVSWGMAFVADIDGESIVLGGTYQTLDSAATEYNYLTGYGYYAWVADETQRYLLGQACVIKKLYVLLNGAPGVGKKYTFTLRAAVVDTNVVVEISGAANTGNSGALEDAVVTDDYMSLKVVPDDTPPSRQAYWGFVCYITSPPLPLPTGGIPPLILRPPPRRTFFTKNLITLGRIRRPFPQAGRIDGRIRRPFSYEVVFSATAVKHINEELSIDGFIVTDDIPDNAWEALFEAIEKERIMK